MTLQTQTFPGAPDGMILAYPPHEIPDTAARYLQDVLVNKPGITVRRGPVTPVVGLPTISDKGSGMVQTIDPAGNVRVGILHDSSAAKLAVFKSDFSALVDVAWTGTLPSSPYYVVDAKPALQGGALIGTSSQYGGASLTQSLGLWNGAGKATYTTGTMTSTRGSKTVSGSGTAWSANTEPGMFLFGSGGALIGTVALVNSDTSLTLMENALVTQAGAAYSLKSVRGLNPRVTKGRITAATTATAVTGGNTKFKDQGLGTGTWDIYRAGDMVFIGTVASVETNSGLTLAANAAVSVSEEAYVAIQRDGDYSLATTSGRKLGFLTATFADRQWYANLGQRKDAVDWYEIAAFSDTDDFESVDLSPVDGDFIPIKTGNSTGEIQAMVPTYNALLFLKEREAFGIYGQSPDNFTLRKIADDGTVSGMSAQPYEGGCIWAGRNGIYFFDGVEAKNITEQTLGDYYRACVRNFNPTSYRMWSMVDRDHYFLFVESVTPNTPVIKGLTSSTPTRLTFIVHLPTQAVVTATNLNIRGAVQLPGSTGRGPSWYLVNSSAHAYVCETSSLFDTSGADSFACDGGTAGPDLYIESKRYTLGDPMRKKLFKQVMFQYQAAGDALKLDTVLGLNDVGTASNSQLPVTVYTWDTLATIYPTWAALGLSFPTWVSLTSGIFVTKRIKFLKRSQEMAFRLYQASSSVTQAQLGPWSLGFKYQRPGRV